MKTSIKKLKRGAKEITLIGVMHIGTINYYKNIQKNLDKNNNVLFEGVTGFNQNNNISNMYSVLAKICGLSFQKEHIKYSKGWIKTDLDYKVLKTANNGCLFEGFNEDSFDEKEEIKKNRFVGKVFILVIRLFKYLNAIRPDNPVTVELRNYKIILDTINYLINNDNVCLFYGEGHLKGVEKYFKKIGFKSVSNLYLNPLKKS